MLDGLITISVVKIGGKVIASSVSMILAAIVVPFDVLVIVTPDLST